METGTNLRAGKNYGVA